VEGVWWPGLGNSVRKSVLGCVLCARHNRVAKIGDVGNVPLSERGRRLVWGIDLTGPWPLSRRGNVYCLTVLDHTSRWPHFVPLVSKEAPVVSRGLLSVVLLMGPPELIISDLGGEFTGRVTKDLQHQLGVRVKHTSGYRPRVNGRTERMNQTMSQMLRKFVESGGDKQDWDEWLPYVELAIRTTKSDATGYTPFYMMFGEECSLFKDYDAEKGDDKLDVIEEVKTRVGHLQHLIEVVQPELLQRLKKKQLSEWRPSQFVNFPVGSWCQVELQRGDKLSARYDGLYRVTKKLDKGAYVLETVLGGRLDGPVNASRMKGISDDVARKMLAPKAKVYEKAEDAVDEENECPIDFIVDHRESESKGRGRKADIEYRVRWTGYGPEDDSWVKKDDIMTRGVIDQYMMRKGKGKVTEGGQ